ncbi:hypothetical protein VPH35_088882 [Triticum aestivum]
MNHILLRCKLAQLLWSKLGLQELATSTTELESFLCSDQPTAIHGKLWHILFAACAVTLWDARNARVFEESFWQERQVYTRLIELIQLWSLRAPQHFRQNLLLWTNALTPN